jgi:hypothetical protein
MSMSPEQTRARAQHAARRRWHGESPDAAIAREALDEATLRAAVDRNVAALVDAFKQATPDQVDGLRQLVAPLVKAVRTDQGGVSG